MQEQIEILKGEVRASTEAYESAKVLLADAIETQAPDHYTQCLRREVSYFDGRRSAFVTAVEVLVDRRD